MFLRGEAWHCRPRQWETKVTWVEAGRVSAGPSSADGAQGTAVAAWLADGVPSCPLSRLRLRSVARASIVVDGWGRDSGFLYLP